MRETLYALAAVLILGAPVCSPADEPGPASEEPLETRVIDALWERRSLVIRQTIELGLFEPWRDFEDAIQFFEDLTGIQSDTGTPYGRMPGPNLGQTLEHWQGWFARNRKDLVWDEDLQAPCHLGPPPKEERSCAVPLERNLKRE